MSFAESAEKPPKDDKRLSWSEEDRQTLRRMRLQGASFEEIRQSLQVERKATAIYTYWQNHFAFAVWSPSVLAEAQRLWEDGAGPGEIAQVLGRGLTGSRVARMAKRHRWQALGVLPQPAEADDGSATDIVSVAESAPCDARLLRDWQWSTCAWPMGHPDDADFHFCGGALSLAADGSPRPYCAEHAARAFRKSSPGLDELEAELEAELTVTEVLA